MIDYETYVKIRNYMERDGLNYSQISAALDLDQRTVARWANEKRYQPRKTTPRKSKLDPFKNDILRMLEKHPYSAAQIFQRISENGFDGGKTIVADYVQRVRPPKTRAYLKLVFAPGECAQVDWGSYDTVRVGGTTRRLSFFVMVLCHSRMMYVEFTVSQTMEHFLGCHQNAFHFFGSVPQKIMVDNLKSAVLKRIVGHASVFNPRYLDFSKHYGFSIVPCNVGKGNEKGQVESGVGYVKKNLLNGLDIPDFKIMKPVARHVRSYDRRQDFEHPDHPKELLSQRKKARDQKIFMRFLTLSDKAQEYYRQLEQRRMNPFHHIRQIVALSEIYSKEQVAMAIEDAFSFAAFSCEYIANLLEQRARPVQEPGVLHLTRSSDLLDLTIARPDLSIYNIEEDKK